MGVEAPRSGNVEQERKERGVVLNTSKAGRFALAQRCGDGRYPLRLQMGSGSEAGSERWHNALKKERRCKKRLLRASGRLVPSMKAYDDNDGRAPDCASSRYTRHTQQRCVGAVSESGHLSQQIDMECASVCQDTSAPFRVPRGHVTTSPIHCAVLHKEQPMNGIAAN